MLTTTDKYKYTYSIHRYMYMIVPHNTSNIHEDTLYSTQSNSGIL